MAERICSIDGCEKNVQGRGWCSAHYTRWRRYGDPLGAWVRPPRKRYLAVPASEKYAELKANGEDRPRCECHGEKRGWQMSVKLIAGGYWGKCPMPARERAKAWKAENPRRRNKERDAETNRRWYLANYEKAAASRARRVLVGNTYVGKATTPEEAAEINQRLRAKLADFREKQQAEYREGIDGWISTPVA